MIPVMTEHDEHRTSLVQATASTRHAEPLTECTARSRTRRADGVKEVKMRSLRPRNVKLWKATQSHGKGAGLESEIRVLDTHRHLRQVMGTKQ